jgi:hypothetical protein
VNLGNFGHKPAEVPIWTGQKVNPTLLPHGPGLSKKQPQKIVIPNPLQGERIDFENFGPTKPGSSCYLSGLIEYSFLDHRYCTRFCRYIAPPDMRDLACSEKLTNNLEEDEGCDQYDAGLPQQ